MSSYKRSRRIHFEFIGSFQKQKYKPPLQLYSYILALSRFTNICFHIAIKQLHHAYGYLAFVANCHGQKSCVPQKSIC